MTTVKIALPLLCLPLAVGTCACPGATPGAGVQDDTNTTGSGSSHAGNASSHLDGSSRLNSSSVTGSGSPGAGRSSSSLTQESGSSSAGSASSSRGGPGPVVGGVPGSRGGVDGTTPRDLPGVGPYVEPPAFVYAHTARDLYVLDADTLELARLGTLTFLDEAGAEIVGATLTDLAVTGQGFLYGCGLRAIYFIDLQTLTARRLSTVNIELTGLTFVPAGVLDPVQEVLLGATRDSGQLLRINPVDGAVTVQGPLGNAWLLSGDLVGIRGGVYGTVRRSSSVHDVLAHVDATTGAVTPIGNGLGRGRVWGLGYWAGTLYGFTDAGEILRVDRTTGRAEVIRTLPVHFYGAAVTTRAAPVF